MVQSMNNNPEEKEIIGSETRNVRKSPSTSQNNLGGGWKFESPEKSKSPTHSVAGGKSSNTSRTDDFGVYSDLARAKNEREKILKPDAPKQPSPTGEDTHVYLRQKLIFGF